MFVVSGLSAWATHTVVRDQERRLLNERASEVGLVFTGAVGSLTTSLDAVLAVLRVAGPTPAAFAKAAAAEPSTPGSTVALVNRQPSGSFSVVAASGAFVKAGDVLSGSRRAALGRATDAGQTSTGVIGSGSARSLGFAQKVTGIPGAASPLYLYREFALGTLSAGRQAGTAPFHEVDVVLYTSSKVDPAQLLVSTAAGSISTKNARFVPLKAGADTWLLGVRAKASLVGGVAGNAWWVVLIAIGVAGLLLASMIQFAMRRRDVALSLYAAEHKQAETLQRSLLPSLPELPGLELAARYEAGGIGQQVGGDWFDVFGLPDGGAGFAIGDVMGHDLEAAAAMSQVRAALRAYGYDGDTPSEVLTRLDNFVKTFELTQLVSVVYGVFSPVAPDGSRTVRYANAGHLPPLLQGPDGAVTALDDGRSVVIGVPFVEARVEATRVLLSGSTVLLFTDGLLEAPGRSLAETIPALERTVAGHSPAAGCDVLCDTVLAARSDQTQRDDIALLALRLQPNASANVPIPRGREAGTVGSRL
jgi:serine phosphatase RsbU (regulator of sigma subunit)